MRLSVQKETNYPKELSYAVLAHGAATGVWTEEDWSADTKSTNRAGLMKSMQQAAMESRKSA